jgi:hypothetical protein
LTTGVRARGSVGSAGGRASKSRGHDNFIVARLERFENLEFRGIRSSL